MNLRMLQAKRAMLIIARREKKRLLTERRRRLFTHHTAALRIQRVFRSKRRRFVQERKRRKRFLRAQDWLTMKRVAVRCTQLQLTAGRKLTFVFAAYIAKPQSAGEVDSPVGPVASQRQGGDGSLGGSGTGVLLHSEHAAHGDQ